MNRRTFLGCAALSAGSATAATTASVGKVAKITGLETDVLRFPPGKPYSDAIHDFGPDRGGVVLRLHTDAGITGWAYSSFGMIGGGAQVVATMLEQELKPALVGQDPAFPKRLRADLWKAVEYNGVQGIATFALAAADIAIWDIIGKMAGMPVYRMLGAFRERMPTYNMCGWYYPDDPDLTQFRRSISAALEEGFRAVKVKVGRSTLDEDVRRIRVAQELCGKERKVMVDANQKFTRNEAIRRGRVYEEMQCAWYEEPLPPYDIDGYAELVSTLDIRIATGENTYTRYAFADLLKRGGADIVQPDNRRAGGVTEWLEIAAIADGFGVEVASHGGGVTNLNMLLAMPNAIYMESGSVKGESSSAVEPLRMKDGEMLPPETPGMGSELKPDWIHKFKVG